MIAYDLADVIISDIYKYLTNKNISLFSRTNCTSFYLDKKYKIHDNFYN